ncbi:hypothetical protein HanRHA438_Chr17g0796701 [Helianthus annuus]|nr:hypothetical protein HanIR_Chr17g0853611 [Helianthus annuus]KAJ0635100.1 hypothetical protein HanOQP8_Chr17g0647191 [Helianthus annuus]KAJ0824835.1 hypothetical protein HanRHA438_Chr17g0796701 [Helianthus annuus]
MFADFVDTSFFQNLIRNYRVIFTSKLLSFVDSVIFTLFTQGEFTLHVPCFILSFFLRFHVNDDVFIN